MVNSISFNIQFSNFYCNSYSIDSFHHITSFNVISSQNTSEISCPHCGSKVHIYDNTSVKLKDMPILTNKRNQLNVSIHRYRCTKCKFSFTEEIPFKYPETRITNRLANFIKSFLKHHMSIKDISEITGVHWNTISKIHKKYMDEVIESRAKELSLKEYKPKYLAVDEFAIHKGHTYATCVMDLEEGDVIWVGSGRAIKDFKKFFEEISPDYLSEVKAVAMDMNASYNRLVEEHLSNADIVYDRFNFQSQFGKDVLGSVRLEEARKHKDRSIEIKESITTDMSKEEKTTLKNIAKEENSTYKKLKNLRWSLLMSNEKLIESRENTLKEILHSHESVAICYAMKEEITRLYELKDEKEAEEGWKNWFKAAKESNIPQLVKFAELKEKRLPGLIAHAKYRIGTGRLEGFNNKIKVAKRIGYGYRNDEHFFTMIKYISISKRHKLSPIKM